MVASTQHRCHTCGSDFTTVECVAKPPCPHCGSTRTGAIVEATFESSAKIMDSLRVQKRDPSRRSADKLRADDFNGWDWSVKLQKYVRKESVIDHDANRRYEKVTDPETGEVIHHCDHPLTEHRGHGSAKQGEPRKKSDHPQPPDNET